MDLFTCGALTGFGTYGLGDDPAPMQQARCPRCGHVLGSMNINDNHEPGCEQAVADANAMRQSGLCFDGQQNFYRVLLEQQREINRVYTQIAEAYANRPCAAPPSRLARIRAWFRNIARAVWR
jgi:hypothetical protein